MNDQIDKLLIANEQMQREIEKLQQQVKAQDGFTKTIIETMRTSEELFELRTTRVLLSLFEGITHSLQHSVEDAQEQLRLRTQGFDIKVVDGANVREAPNTIVVTKTETGYDYAPAATPTNIMNENTEAFSEYFDKNPSIFGDRKEILVNITVDSKILKGA